VARIDIATGSWTQLWEAERFIGADYFLPADVDAEGERIVFESESAVTPPDIWFAFADSSDPRRVTTIAPGLTGKSYGSSSAISWHTADGELVHGALLLPRSYTKGRRYPLIVYPYPNAHRSNNVFQYGLNGIRTENMQVFATRGYAVLAPDAPVDEADQLHSLANVILPGVDKVIAMGIADSARLGIMGHSWGGYTVLSLLVQTTRFKAAVMRGGYGDLPAMNGEMEASGAARGQVLNESGMGATLWANRSRYVDNSPVFFLDRIRTPLLIVHGAGDETVPVSAADEVFVDLRRLGGEVEYARYTGENHVEAGWSFANQKDYMTRVLRWFDDHLHPHEIAPDSSADATNRDTAQDVLNK
jgi:dipeptidyl aminopeptidase/acylaminoacyl peptidase